MSNHSYSRKPKSYYNIKKYASCLLHNSAHRSKLLKGQIGKIFLSGQYFHQGLFTLQTTEDYILLQLYLKTVAKF